MVYVRTYKDLIVWQKSILLAKEIFRFITLFPKSEMYGIVSQMRRAVVSICSNIAEGYGRRSRNEYRHFLTISYGSVLELETQIILSKELMFVSLKEFEKSEELLLEVSKMLNVMINKAKD